MDRSLVLDFGKVESRIQRHTVWSEVKQTDSGVLPPTRRQTTHSVINVSSFPLGTSQKTQNI